MKRFNSLLVSVFVVCITTSLHTPLTAQTLQYLNVNNINAGIARGASLFSSAYSLPSGLNDLYEVPKGSGISAVYTAALWMSAFDSLGNLHGAAQRYNQNGRDYWDGPIVAIYDSAYDNYYGRVFKITQTQIAQFRALTFPTNYSAIDSAILLWPGKGNPFVVNNYEVNISSALAPFHDVDNDGIYNPANGDYPAICGDEAIFFVYNDARYPHTESGCTDSLGFEIRGMAYSFTDSTPSASKSAIDNTIFVQYDIENKSSTNYNNFLLGLWEDPDLGCFDNDRVGCDTDRNLMFVYNGTTPDPDCGMEYGYGYTSVSHGVKMLNQKMSVFGYFTNGADFSQQDQDPDSCEQFREYLTGFWNDGSPFTFGGTGYHSSDTITKFCFPSDPNDSTGWSDATVAAQLPAGDRRMYGSMGPMNFNLGETKHFDFAFSTSYDSSTTTDMLKIVDTLKRDADIVQQYYTNQILPCRNELITLGVNTLNVDELGVSIFPNPSNHQINIETAEPIQWFEVTDVEGRLIHHQTASGTKNTLDVSYFAKGVYLLKLESEGKFAIKKIVVD